MKRVVEKEREREKVPLELRTEPAQVSAVGLIDFLPISPGEKADDGIRRRY